MHASTQALSVATEQLRRIEARDGESCECCGYPFDGGDVAYQGRDNERIVCSKSCMTRLNILDADRYASRH